MWRLSKISGLAVFCGVAMLVAPPTAHAEPQLQFVLNGVAFLTQPITGSNGVVTFGTLVHGLLKPLPVGPFMVSLTGQSHLGRKNGVGQLKLMATITGGGPLDTLTILLTETNYPQAGNAIFADNVQGTITGPGSVRFQAFLDFTNRPFGGILAIPPQKPTGPFLPLLGPFIDPHEDASYSGSGSQQVTDTSPSSTTAQSQVNGGDVTFTFVVTNTVNR